MPASVSVSACSKVASNVTVGALILLRRRAPNLSRPYRVPLYPWLPAMFVVVAATLGAAIVFFASKTALGDLLKGRVTGFLSQMEKGFRENELSYMFILRLAPVFPFWGVNIAAGLLGVSARNFLVGTFFGIIPGSFVYASIGAAAGAAFDAGEDVSLSGILFKPETLLPIVGLALLSLTPIALKRFRKKSGAQ